VEKNGEEREDKEGLKVIGEFKRECVERIEGTKRRITREKNGRKGE
jgi:hypothetical protein